jgi:hypothetical protein
MGHLFRHRSTRLALSVCQSTLCLLLTFTSCAGQAFSKPAQAGSISKTITLPIEVMGEDGTEVAVDFILPHGAARQVTSLWMQAHGLEYADLASVQLNGAVWTPLNNQTAAVAEPGRSYGGIGGGFATLKLTLPLASGSATDGSNVIRFRFNRSNGVVSGFRILAFNLLTIDGRNLLPQNSFIEEDPNLWSAPLSTSEDISAGQRWWQIATLKADNRVDSKNIRAHCSNCHSADGRDLKYFNYSNGAIEARSRFHGLSARQGEQIASYIRALPFANPGRPWNPPYQPGPGLESSPVANWAAGAGLDWVLNSDTDSLPYMFKVNPGISAARSATQSLAITPAAFAPDGDLRAREIPIAMQLPDWNHWLPQVHPLDSFGDGFEKSEFARDYRESRYTGFSSLAAFRTFFAGWLRARNRFLNPPVVASTRWSPAMSQSFYSAMLWQLVKTWEITEKFELESGGPGTQRVLGSTYRESWLNATPAATAPASAHIPDGPNGMNGSTLTNEYFDNAWYELQILLNDGDHRHHGRGPVDWVYMAGRVHDLERTSGRSEPGRLLVMAIKAMQSTDPKLGPENLTEGWRPEFNLDPRVMIAPDWRSTFSALPTDQRKAIADAWLSAWLEKNSQYPTASYFYRGQVPGSYAAPPNLQDISGGKVWESAARFRSAGVDAGLVLRLQAWGANYVAGTALFHY